MKTLLLVIGVLVFAAGALWTGQGLGWIAWPEESFMISQIQWAYYGAATAAAGLLLIVWSRR
jgi:uncharacterized membrane protein